MAGQSIGYNPFLGLPPPDPSDPRAMMSQAVQTSLAQPRAASAIAPRPSVFAGQGPLLSLADHAALAKAPKLAGTAVTVEAYPAVPPLKYDHMYALYDDGKDQYIYRGGGNPPPFLHAQVTRADQSPDFQKGERVLFQQFLPGVRAPEAIAPAQADAARINNSGDPYLVATSNSNSVIGGFTARQFGHRIGEPIDLRTGTGTPGYTYDPPDHFLPQISIPGRGLYPPGYDPVPPGVYRPTTPIW